ncbi:Protein CBG12505 [Caenorhabditis briggsae]|uniref:Protein CBG12505 n=1 Tax=Caenorhabditis briggsae TaxID=6238 RepID=A8XFX4_CAEBR|nr:Protein CBG12505 [Caenorhabditis briggsae]CAP31478.2 Protein CBG12505 [Caenorhabditis briggsae]
MDERLVGNKSEHFPLDDPLFHDNKYWSVSSLTHHIKKTPIRLLHSDTIHNNDVYYPIRLRCSNINGPSASNVRFKECREYMVLRCDGHCSNDSDFRDFCNTITCYALNS